MRMLAVIIMAGVVLLPRLPAGGASPAGTYRVGFLGASQVTPFFEAFRAGLHEHGYVEGRTVRLEARWIEGRSERVSTLAAELLGLPVDVLVVGTTQGALVAKAASQTTPIVFVGLGDPVGTGLVASLPRPGGNVTGLSFQGTELARKQLDLLKETLPKLSRVVVLVNPANASHRLRVQEAQSAGAALKVQVRVREVSRADDLGATFSTLTSQGAEAVLVPSDSLFTREAAQLAGLADRNRLPVMYGLRDHVAAGGLMAYGASFRDLYRRAAGYVDRILRGARPADLPVEQPTRFELVINLRTARALGLTIPAAVLARADEILN